MCMFFILRVAQRGCERELRGIQRLLCTLLCTRSHSPFWEFQGTVQPASSGPRMWRNSENICPAFCLKEKTRTGLVEVAIVGTCVMQIEHRVSEDCRWLGPGPKILGISRLCWDPLAERAAASRKNRRGCRPSRADRGIVRARLLRGESAFGCP